MEMKSTKWAGGCINQGPLKEQNFRECEIMCATAHSWRSEDSSQELVLSCHFLGSRN